MKKETKQFLFLGNNSKRSPERLPQGWPPGTDEIGQKGAKMKYIIEIIGKLYNDRYTFETTKDGNISEEVSEIIKEMEVGNISAFKIEV